MKVRTGFVSNSSSASYILALDRKPETTSELHEIMFPEGAYRIRELGRMADTHDLAGCLFGKIVSEQKKSATVKEMLNIARGLRFRGEWYRNEPLRSHYTTEEEYRHALKEYWDKIYAEARAYEKKQVMEFRKANKGKFFICCSFSDHNTLETFLHNGVGLEHLPNIYISNH